MTELQPRQLEIGSVEQADKTQINSSFLNGRTLDSLMEHQMAVPQEPERRASRGGVIVGAGIALAGIAVASRSPEVGIFLGLSGDLVAFVSRIRWEEQRAK